MNAPRFRLSAYLALASLAFAAAHLACEHLAGGVQSHHLLNRPDLPAISNGFGLVVLPLLGGLFGTRVHNRRAGRQPSGRALSAPCRMAWHWQQPSNLAHPP